jgi:hypothetical protein
MEITLDEIELDDIDGIIEDVLKDTQFDANKEAENSWIYNKRVSVNDLVPEEYQQKLMAVDSTLSGCFWIVGDIANELTQSINRIRAQEVGKAVSQKDILEAVGYFCHRTGRSVRHYFECARFFTPDIRKKYDVPFIIYSDARWVDKPELMLQIAADNPQWGASRVRVEYYKTMGVEPTRRADKETAIEAEEEPEESGRYKSVLIAKLEKATDALRDVADKLPLSTQLRIRIGECILELQNIGIEIRGKMW